MSGTGRSGVVVVTRQGAAVLVLACGAAKADQRRPAMDLYTGSLFRAARRAAQADGRPWLICSAEHGLVHPHQPLDPYERALADTDADVARLGGLIAGQRHLLLAAAGAGRELGVEVWAPARYTAALRAGGVDVRLTPLAGLGLGAQIGWLTRHAHSCEDYHQRTGPGPARPRPPGGSRPTTGWCTPGASPPSTGSRSWTWPRAAGSTTAACSGAPT